MKILGVRRWRSSGGRSRGRSLSIYTEVCVFVIYKTIEIDHDTVHSMSSMSSISEHSDQQYPSRASSSRKRADPHHPWTPTPPHVRRSSDVEQQPPQVVISAYLRSSYYDDDDDAAARSRRFSSAEHYYSPPPTHHNSQGEIRRLSANFNAPTQIEVERHRDCERSLRGTGKLKSAVRGLVRA
jgi:hypothetical protein